MTQIEFNGYGFKNHLILDCVASALLQVGSNFFEYEKKYSSIANIFYSRKKIKLCRG
jgi:hypothetical protein